MPVPDVYRGQGGVNASFDWLDLTAGAGYKKYYAAVANLSGSTAYILTGRPFDSSTTNGIFTVNDGNGSVLNKNFDITFNVPATVGGADAFVNITMYCTGVGNSDITATLQKVPVSGSTVTIGTAVTAGDVGTNTYRHLIRIVCTKTSFAVGDKLRLNILSHMTAPNTVKFYHDPNSTLTYSDQQSRTVGSDLIVDVPFKIDL